MIPSHNSNAWFIGVEGGELPIDWVRQPQEAEIEGLGGRVYEIRRAPVSLGFCGHAGGAWACAAVSLESDRCEHSGALNENATRLLRVEHGHPRFT